MIDHVTIRVSDVERTKKFYSEALKPLGYEVGMNETFDGVRVVGLGSNGKLDIWFTTDLPQSTQVHLAFKGNSHEQVEQFYTLALAAGGTDNGAPGLRPEYHENYYAAFVLDPDGNNIEVVAQ